MNKSIYAPVVIFVYNRRKEIENLIRSLIKNELANESEVYIFSDGPKNDEDLIKVNEVRDYIDSLGEKNYFRKLTISKSEKNKGLAKSVISGVTEVINKFDKVIVIEDDLTVSSVFLLYMNTCLNFYYDNKQIWSISGYTRDMDTLKYYEKNVYLGYRGMSTGWATWKDRWDMVDWDVKDYKFFLFNPFANIRFSRGGADLPGMLKMQKRGWIDSWAVRWCYSQSKNNMLTVMPRKTMILIGGMENGTHSTSEDADTFNCQRLDEIVSEWCYDDLIVEKKIIKEYRHLVNPGLSNRIKNELRYLRDWIRSKR